MHCSSVTAASLHRQPGQQHLCIGSKALRFSHSGIFASAARPCGSVTAAPCHQKLRHGALASNKPHPAEKSTPVWLPIWCTWAGFTNSQLRCATFHSTYSYKCTSSLLPPWSRCSDRRKSIGPSAPIANATSVSPPNEAVAWPWGACIGWQMMLLLGRGTVLPKSLRRYAKKEGEILY